MPSWKELLTEFQSQPDDAARGTWLNAKLTEHLAAVATLRGGRNVILSASAFLQKPQLPGFVNGISAEDTNALMAVIHGMDCAKGLTLVLHTPGGSINAAETVVAYLRSKFDYIEVVVPLAAMSAGTMISLASDLVIMGRQSQLGPIDPQLTRNGQSMSAQAIVDQFEAAKVDILKDLNLAHLWAPLLQAAGPSLLQEAKNSLEFGERMVAEWLSRYMFRDVADAVQRDNQSKATAAHFNDASTHKSHGRRIDRDEARSKNVKVEDLEPGQSLQEAVLTAYHVVTLMIMSSPAAKIFYTDSGQSYVKNHTIPGP
jgi:hypothetical protein